MSAPSIREPLSRVWCAVWLWICMLPFAANAGESSAVAIEDLATRLQFDFYAGDVRALQRDTDTLSRTQTTAETRITKLLWTAYGQWKQAEMLRVADPAAAGRAVNACIETLESALMLDGNRADGLAMLALCYGVASQVQSRLRQPLALVRMRQMLSRAVEQSPRHPQVLLSSAINDFERPQQGAADLTAVEQKLRAAIDAYEAPTYVRNSSLWGHPEAWAYLGRLYLARNDLSASRDALEHALVLAADYADARKLLQQVVQGAAR